MHRRIIEALRRLRARLLRLTDGDPGRLAEHGVLAGMTIAFLTLGGLDLLDGWTSRNADVVEIGWSEMRRLGRDGDILSVEVSPVNVNDVGVSIVAARIKPGTRVRSAEEDIPARKQEKKTAGGGKTNEKIASPRATIEDGAEKKAPEDAGAAGAPTIAIARAVPIQAATKFAEEMDAAGAKAEFRPSLPTAYGGKTDKGHLEAFTSILFKAFGLVIPFAVIWMITQQARTMTLFTKRPGKSGGNDGTGFKDIAGLAEAKRELRETVEFLSMPERFLAVGAEPPKGILLVGPPGNGKTLLARAVAGEAGCSFLQASGSEFDEMFVGLGAKRVRELFAAARKMAPCIVFVDEIDAMASKRSETGGGHENQTVNQILTEMDGFSGKDGVVVIAATNLIGNLDPAILRPGRFTRHIQVTQPDLSARKELLAIHGRGKPFSPELSIDAIARSTAGFSGADLANLCNEAAIRTARDGRTSISDDDFDSARDRILLGTENAIALGPEERSLIAVHEAGHAVVAALTQGSDPIHKATILPRGGALGAVVRHGDGDRVIVRRGRLLAELRVAMGGRAAERVIYGNDDVSTGAADDIRVAGTLARRMIEEWGMGTRLVGNASSKASMENAADEADALVSEALDVAQALVVRHRDALDAVTEALLERETIDGENIDELLAQAASLDEDERKAIDARRAARAAEPKFGRRDEPETKTELTP
jgi:cell division protease FtsH